MRIEDGSRECRSRRVWQQKRQLETLPNTVPHAARVEAHGESVRAKNARVDVSLVGQGCDH